MSTKLKLLAMASAAILALPTAGSADTINFSQFGANNQDISGPATGTTTGGVDVTITSPNGGFTVEQQGNGWYGAFPNGALVLYDGFGSGAVTLQFSSPLSALTLAAQGYLQGSFTETMTAFSASNLAVGTVSATGSIGPSGGSAPFITVNGSGADIAYVTIDAVNDDIGGFALYGGSEGQGIPEPASMTLMGAGLVGVAMARRKRRR